MTELFYAAHNHPSDALKSGPREDCTGCAILAEQCVFCFATVEELGYLLDWAIPLHHDEASFPEDTVAGEVGRQIADYLHHGHRVQAAYIHRLESIAARFQPDMMPPEAGFSVN